MLNQKDNELIARVGPGTAMGALVRRFWVPFLQSSELPAPDCDPVRVTLLGEHLVAFRDSESKVGLVDQHCPHRNANLFFGRNEEQGLRCTYHGWKFDVDGNCVEMPSEDEESTFKDKIHLTAYPVREVAGVLWAYLGPKNYEPEMPEFEWMRVPENHLYTSWNIQENNFVQAIEGGIDSAHVNYLHSTLDAHRQKDSDAMPSIGGGSERLEGDSEGAMRYMRLMNRDKHPKLYVKRMEYGLLIGAQRRTGEDRDYWRLNNFLMPFFTTPPGRSMHAFVPLDDEHTARWSFTWKVNEPYSAGERAAMRKGANIHSELIPGTHIPTHNKSNDYLIDRQMQRLETYTGIKDFGAQDYSIQEGMGVISDRSREHLGVTDKGIIAMRQTLLEAVQALLDGHEPSIRGAAYNVIGGQALVPVDQSWEESEAVISAIMPNRNIEPIKIST